MTENTKNRQMTRSKMRNSIIVTVVSSIIISSLGGAGSVYAFYYKTKTSIDNLILNDTKQDATLKEINNKLSSSVTNSAISESEIEHLQEDIQQIRLKQDKIYDLLLEIKKD